ncbi:MAG: hypothetical protein K2N73_17205 [Lachnospiraceae bacterium]|nr:hypothetical protein [Lachnospiraceae bacterium]
MLGKLFKYEWKGFRFPMLIMLIVLAGTTVLTCSVIITINPRYDETFTWYSVMALMLSVFLYYFGIIGCSLGVLLIIAIRFYKTCYTDQGYLTHTLPVSTQKILNVKIISSAAAVLLLILAVAGSLFIIAHVGINHILTILIAESHGTLEDIAEARRVFFNEMSTVLTEFEDELGISLGMYLVYMVVYFLIAVIANVVTILGCVSLGQLYTKHRIIGAIIAYFVVQFILKMLGYFASMPMYAKLMRVDSYYEEYTAFGIASPTMNLALLFSVIMAVVMYFINLHMMTKKLNLE